MELRNMPFLDGRPFALAALSATRPNSLVFHPPALRRVRPDQISSPNLVFVTIITQGF
jgi:hypothetical protein